MSEYTMTREEIERLKDLAGNATPEPWFVSGVRFDMAGANWHGIGRYDESKKKDEQIACVGFDKRTGLGRTDADFIAASRQAVPALIGMVEGLTGDARFLLDRLSELEIPKELARDWFGHVEPAIARLRARAVLV